MAHAALSLWRCPGQEREETAPPVFGHVLLTTLLNPKALVLALVVMPEGGTAPAVEAIAALRLFIADGLDRGSGPGCARGCQTLPPAVGSSASER